ncbi:hypothetical protein F7234_03620 [Pseudomonas putida]|uniref:hypothetical protein n=1 Tax=Pseudomonas putida TaxID=303 RepID=UPI00125F159A|nr:hypothetical protein [Pseudomonas putida]KAB5626241.1 hypothetical protein F7234_03620 [Pseudomonas putida]
MTKMSELYEQRKISYITDSFKDLKPGSELKGKVKRPGYTLTLNPDTGDAMFFVVEDDDKGTKSIIVGGTNGHWPVEASFELTFNNPTNYLALECFSSSWGYSRVVIYDKDGNPLHEASVDTGTVVKYSGPGIYRAVYEGTVEEFGLTMRLISVTHGLAQIKGS